MSGNYQAGVTGNESYFNPNTTATCAECGAEIYAEQDHYGISRDGGQYCCSLCLQNMTRLNTIHYSSGEWGGSAEVGNGFDRVTVEVRGRSQAEALKKAEDYGEIINEGVHAYIEEG